VDKDELFEDQPRSNRIWTFCTEALSASARTPSDTRATSIFSACRDRHRRNFTAYSLPDAIKPYYGDRPLGGNVFIRFRLRPSEK
jgi:hypothetical protein